jgi:hypothetical protein
MVLYLLTRRSLLNCGRESKNSPVSTAYGIQTKIASESLIGREIPEEIAARTDRENEFPMELWKKLGEAG